MSQRLPRRPGVVLALLVAVLGLVAALTSVPAIATATTVAPAASPPPQPTLSPTPSPTPTSSPAPADPCDPDDAVSVGDFVMWDSAIGGSTEVPVVTRYPCRYARTIVFRTFDITARAGHDYVGVSQGTVVIPAGRTSARIAVTIIGDTLHEGTERFGIRLVAGARFADREGIVTLVDR